MSASRADGVYDVCSDQWEGRKSARTPRELVCGHTPPCGGWACPAEHGLLLAGDVLAVMLDTAIRDRTKVQSTAFQAGVVLALRQALHRIDAEIEHCRHANPST